MQNTPRQTASQMNLSDAKKVLEEAAKRSRSSARLTRQELMTILGLVYSISLGPDDHEALMEHIRSVRSEEGANRSWVQSANPFTLPLRYVFPSLSDRTNISRYAGALMELRERGVPPDQFPEKVKESGGLIDLYWSNRERETKVLRRSKLTLNRNLVFTAGTPVTLKLLPQANGVFMVLDYDG